MHGKIVDKGSDRWLHLLPNVGGVIEGPWSEKIPNKAGKNIPIANLRGTQGQTV